MPIILNEGAFVLNGLPRSPLFCASAEFDLEYDLTAEFELEQQLIAEYDAEQYLLAIWSDC
jgi:hypothetical protein